MMSWQEAHREPPFECPAWIVNRGTEWSDLGGWGERWLWLSIHHEIVLNLIEGFFCIY
jgi:hypothetical protein